MANDKLKALSELLGNMGDIDESEFMDNTVEVNEERNFIALWVNSNIDPTDIRELDDSHLDNILAMLKEKGCTFAHNVMQTEKNSRQYNRPDAELNSAEIAHKRSLIHQFDEVCETYLENPDVDVLTVIPIENEDKRYRIRTEEEFVAEYGDSWKSKCNGGWNSKMDELFGREISFEDYKRIICSPTQRCYTEFEGITKGFSIATDMIVVS